MRYTRYILLVFALMASACTQIEPINSSTDSQVQFVGRVIPFSDCDVTTKAAKNEPKEYQVKTLDLIIFNSEYTCVYYTHSPNGESVFSIDRGSDTNDDKLPDNGDFIGMDQNLLDECTIYAIANVPELNEAVEAGTLGKGSNVSEFLNIYSPVTSIDVPSTGMPMLGYYTDSQGNLGTVDLSVDSQVRGNTPFEVHMYALYSKIVFELDVYATEHNTIYRPFFTLEGFEVHNVVKRVDFAGGDESPRDKNDGTNDSTPLIMSGDKGKVFQGALTGNTIAYDRGERLTFSFYLPERFLRAGTAAKDYSYPFRDEGAIRPEDTILCQRYKPALAQKNANGDTIATFVRIRGVFSNHQQHTYNAYYDIYLGNDNYGNFDIVRNRQYNNFVTIKGINNTSDNGAEKVAFDHRVNVTRTNPFIANLRRETLLDSHFEVRPLRIKANINDETFKNHKDNSAVKVEVIYLNNETGDNRWVGLERSYGNGNPPKNDNIYCNGSNGASSAGKRKYFTTDLTYNELGSTAVGGLSTSGGQVVVVPLNSDATSECVWIYIDECTTASTDVNATRSAKIKLTYGTINDGSFAEYAGIDPLEYIINQHYLFEVIWEGKHYHIEHEEEYLHNFDSETNYGETTNQTQHEGMVWGLYNAQLSFDNQALFLEADNSKDLITQIANSNNKPYYDFYIPHDTSIPENAVKRSHSGYVFCNEIIKDINTKNNANRNTGYSGTIGSLQMDQTPSSAIEYCYNRNKRNSNGTINTSDVNWYLPAIDEMEDIIMGGYSAFDDFHNKFYWSCQPGYLQNYIAFWSLLNIFSGAYIYGSHYFDDTGKYVQSSSGTVTKNNGYARATRANYRSNNNYDYSYSGTSGYDNALIYASVFSSSVQYTGTYNNQKLEDWNTEVMESIVRQEGNRPRDSKNRVRCVRKSNYTNTNTGEE